MYRTALEEEIAATPESVQYEALQDREENVCDPPSSDNETGDVSLYFLIGISNV